MLEQGSVTIRTQAQHPAADPQGLLTTAVARLPLQVGQHTCCDPVAGSIRVIERWRDEGGFPSALGRAAHARPVRG
jgi:hypothetical protein